ncbi:MAG: YgfZ/GcvT domain-containing protein [Candidatus Rokuibacteriota bacterium]
MARSSMPSSDAGVEYAAVRHAVGVMDRSTDGVVEVTGRDRASFLHAMLSNDVKSLAPGQGCEASLLDVHGKVQVLLRVLVLEERIVMFTPPGMAAKTVEGLDRYLFSEKAYLVDKSGELTLLLLAGPAAAALVERLAGVRPPDTAWSSVAASIAGAETRLVRGAGETGEPEVWLVCSATDGAAVLEAVTAAGAPPVGARALESLRIEAGTACYGEDVDDTVLLPEISFSHLVSHTKGCYIGQEVVVRIRDRGHVNRHLRGLLLDGDAVPLPGTPVLAGDAEVGRVTSATRSLGTGRPIALAFVRRQHAEPGTALRVRSADGETGATVSALPFPR